MGLSWMGLNILKKIAKMSLELLGLLLELLLELLLLLLYAFYHVLIRGCEAPPCNPFDCSHTGARGCRPRALLAGLRFALPCAPTAFALTKNYAQGHSLALSLGLGAFFRSTWPARPRFCSPGRPLGRSRARFFDVFRSYLSLEVNIARHQQNTGRSGTKRISGLPRIEPKTLKFRSTSAFVRVRHSAHLQRASGELSESVLGMPGAFLERSWMPRGDPESALGDPGCAFSRSRGVPAAPRSIPAATRIALNRPRSIFRRFVVDFSSIWG